MEAEGEEDVVAVEALVPGVEVALGHREGMTEVEGAVHVGVGESLEPLGLLVGFHLPIAVPLPNQPCSPFHRHQFVSSSSVLHGCCLDSAK